MFLIWNNVVPSLNIYFSRSKIFGFNATDKVLSDYSPTDCWTLSDNAHAEVKDAYDKWRFRENEFIKLYMFYKFYNYYIVYN